MEQFKALLITKTNAGQKVAWTRLGSSDLMAGDVDVAISCSSLNYKDGLAITGKAPVIRRWPMIPGVDLTGRVIRSQHDGFKVGDDVLLNGWGLGETHLGGYAQLARVNGDWLIKRPAAFTAEQAMAIGTAGYTAMLCVLALERHGIMPGTGPVLVTGAAGGVGSVAVSLLAGLGYEVVAATGRMNETEFLHSLGASALIDRTELAGPAKPLGKERWAGAVDVAGSHTLANVLAMTRYGGCVAACGLAHGLDLPSSVAPFILRGVTLAGVESVKTPIKDRIEAWDRLVRDLDLALLATLTQTHSIDDVVDLAAQIVEGKTRGRHVLQIV